MTLDNLFCAIVVGSHFFFLVTLWLRMGELEKHIGKLILILMEDIVSKEVSKYNDGGDEL